VHDLDSLLELCMCCLFIVLRINWFTCLSGPWQQWHHATRQHCWCFYSLIISYCLSHLWGLYWLLASFGHVVTRDIPEFHRFSKQTTFILHNVGFLF